MTADQETVFQEPWEARAFAIVVALYERGLFTWREWAETLAARIATADSAGAVDTGYYEHWLDALEDMLMAKQVTSPAETQRWLGAWRRAFDRTPHGAPIELRPGDF